MSKNETCIKCGHRLVRAANFCTGCGSPTTKEDGKRKTPLRRVFIVFGVTSVLVGVMCGDCSNQPNKSEQTFAAWAHSLRQMHGNFLDSEVVQVLETHEKQLKFQVSEGLIPGLDSDSGYGYVDEDDLTSWQLRIESPDILLSDLGLFKRIGGVEMPSGLKITTQRAVGGPLSGVFVVQTEAPDDVSTKLVITSTAYALRHRTPSDAAEHLCKSGEVPGVKIPNLAYECKEMVTNRLVSPSTATFPGVLSSPSYRVDPRTCDTSWSAWVDSQNRLGATIRTNFSCTFRASTGLIEILTQ